MNQVYHSSRSLRSAGIFVIAAHVFLFLLLLVALILDQRPLASYLFLPILLINPLNWMGIYFFIRHSDAVTLTDTHITWQRFQRHKTIPYTDITGYQERDYHLPPNLILFAENDKLRLNRRLENFPDLYQALRQRIPALQQPELPQFPWQLRLQSRYLWSQAGIALLLIVGFGAMSLLIADRQNRWEAFLVLEILIGVMLLAALLMEMHGPANVRFTPDTIKVHNFWRSPQIWDARSIVDVRLNRNRTLIRGIERIMYDVEIRFDDGRVLTIEEARSWAFGYDPSRLCDMLHRLYLNPAPGSSRQSAQARADDLLVQANAWRQQQAYEEAIAAYSEAIRLFPPYHTHRLVMADLLYDMGRFAEAATNYEALVQLTPEHDQAWYGFGLCQMRLGQPAAAAGAFDQVLELDTTNAQAYYAGAMAYTLLDDRKQGRRYLLRALDLKPEWRDSARQDAVLQSYFA
ncbi:MAG: tetratricopeptide repeat protein [Anaerolineales bacterium]|nr:tetratricopeptide repeat protein [Anaerolineales bacterium]MCB8952878.1 tetratricopeptide repeat protein [Ardenticatenales bacterium]